jgi:hypothetical protein
MGKRKDFLPIYETHQASFTSWAFYPYISRMTSQLFLLIGDSGGVESIWYIKR